mgnify:CR=1 FL=1
MSHGTEHKALKTPPRRYTLASVPQRCRGSGHVATQQLAARPSRNEQAVVRPHRALLTRNPQLIGNRLYGIA